MSGFKQFLLRGNVVDLAVGVVVGAAFGTVVTAFVKDLLTPLIAGRREEARLFRIRN
jgi:large conductance mechanosensitive channel